MYFWVYFSLFLPCFIHLFTALSQQKQNICLPTNVLFFCLSKPQAWHIIRRKAVYHHALACISLRLDDIQGLRLDLFIKYNSIHENKHIFKYNLQAANKYDIIR